MENLARFKGICPAIVSPCDEADNLDENAFGKQVEHLYGEGIHGLYLTGLTGQGYFMTVEERKRIFSLGVELSKNKGYTIAHTGTQDTRSTCILTEHAVKCGADAIAAIPPINRSHRQICAYYEDIVRAADGLPVFVYHIPSYTHHCPTFEQFRDLVEIKGVVGLKYTDADLHIVRKILSIRDDVLVLYGKDEQVLGGFLFGAQAGVGSTYNVLAKTYVDLWQACRDKNWNEALRLQNRVTEFFNIAENFDLMQVIEYILKRKNILTKCFRKPAFSLPVDQHKKLDGMLDAGGFI